MALFGADFKRAKTDWLYPREVQQTLWRGLLWFVVLAVLDGVLQTAGGVASYFAIFRNGFQQFLNDMSTGSPAFMKASIIGITPAAVLVVILALYFAQFGMSNRMGKLPLRMPQLRFFGWVALIAGFCILMWLVFIGAFLVLGIDPETYSPAGGLNDGHSASGLVEKTIADLSKEPWLFALALPGIILGAPVTEELIFRGALFSALVNSRLGRVGAVVISSVLWALIHLSAAPRLYVGVIFIMGLVLGVLLLRFGSLWVTIACHAAWNTFNSVAIFGIGVHS